MHRFIGKWITDREFCELKPRNVFHKQLELMELPCEEHRNRHILFRRKFTCKAGEARLYISADDYYKVYINGRLAGQGPTPAYHFQYNYNVLDVSEYLVEGENLIAVHTLYQGLINRVWQSGDLRHGLILDLAVEGEVVLSSDETFKTRPHSAFTELGITGKHHTQFLEQYDSRAAEVGFEGTDFDDSAWEYAKISRYADHTLVEQKSKMPILEERLPQSVKREGNRLLYDFGMICVGYLCVRAEGKSGDLIRINCGQEFNEDGSLRSDMRANARYEETWILDEGENTLEQYDYKAVRYAQLEIPEGVKVTEVSFTVKHYPFTLERELRAEFRENPDLKRVWELCINTQRYGVQEVIQDCMDREKGFYVGDGCYTALTHMILTEDDSMVRKLIDDAFSSAFVTDTLLACLDCSYMQEVAEYPLIMIYLIRWHYNYTKDLDYLRQNYEKSCRLLDAYRREYEKEGLLRDLDKWCVVDWPDNFRHGYDVDISQRQVCHEAHVSLNAYYLAAIRTVNGMAKLLGLPPYRTDTTVEDTFYTVFYNPEAHLFRDGEFTQHISPVGNCFVYGLELCKDREFEEKFLAEYRSLGIHSFSFFCTFLLLKRFAKEGRFNLLREAFSDRGAWLRMMREGGTVTFESWGKETKKNTSLFHLTMSFAALFMADIDLAELFEEE